MEHQSCMTAEDQAKLATPAKPASEVVDVITPKLKALSEAAIERRRVLDIECDKLPQKIECERHKGNLCELDRDGTSRRTWQLGEFSPIYGKCPECLNDETKSAGRKLGVPELYLGKTLDDWTAKNDEDLKNLVLCRKFAASQRGILILLGGVGNGKTHLGCAILQDVGRGQYITHPQLLELRRASYGSNAAHDKARNEFERLMNRPLLFIDDFGTSVGGDDDVAMRHEIIDHHYSEKLPLVISANMDKERFVEYVGVRATDRLRECGRVLLFGGESERKVQRKEYL